MASFLILLTRSLIALLCLSSSVSSITLSKFLKRQINTVVVATSLSLPLAAHAVPLGLHSGCAYPACTSQLEVCVRKLYYYVKCTHLSPNSLCLQILQSSAPGLVANDIKIAQVRALKDIQFALVQLTSLAQDKVVSCLRIYALRSILNYAMNSCFNRTMQLFAAVCALNQLDLFESLHAKCVI